MSKENHVKKTVSARAFSALAMLVVAIPAAAADTTAGLKILRNNACMGCHAVDQKRVGPSFQQIADRYQSDPQAIQKLSEKIQKGGAGVWGIIPMPAHPRMSHADLRLAAAWILTKTSVPPSTAN